MNDLTFKIRPEIELVNMSCYFEEVSVCKCEKSSKSAKCKLRLGGSNKDYKLAKYLHKHKVFQPYLRCELERSVSGGKGGSGKHQRGSKRIAIQKFSRFCKVFDDCYINHPNEKLPEKPKLYVTGNVLKITGSIEKSHKNPYVWCWVTSVFGGKFSNEHIEFNVLKETNYLFELQFQSNTWSITCGYCADIAFGEEASIGVKFKPNIDEKSDYKFPDLQLKLPKNFYMIEICNHEMCWEKTSSKLMLKYGFFELKQNLAGVKNDIESAAEILVRAHYGYEQICSEATAVYPRETE